MPIADSPNYARKEYLKLKKNSANRVNNCQPPTNLIECSSSGTWETLDPYPAANGTVAGLVS